MADESGWNPNPGKDLPSSSPSPGTPEQSVRPRLNLLLAEDNLPDALLVREVIRTQKLPLDVYAVADGQTAIDFIENAEANAAAPCPHFMLLDLNLPKRDGFEVLKRLRQSEKCKHVPVVVITSSDSPGDRTQAAEMGAVYFRKPPSLEEFLKLGSVLKALLRDTGAIDREQ
jgi:two-component system, chemotaxis family, response regulator Rcp1